MASSGGGAATLNGAPVVVVGAAAGGDKAGDPLLAAAPDEAHETGFEGKGKNLPAYRLVMLVTISIFMGYACLNALQHKIKIVMGIPDTLSPRSKEFDAAVSFLYFGNLVFRMAHNVVFAPLIPRHRVYVSFICMCGSMTMIGVLIFILRLNHMVIIFLAYSLGGVAIGTFESNLLSAISPLGHATKTWAVVGIPLGYNIINIGSFAAFAFDPDSRMLQLSMYIVVFATICVAALVFRFYIPYHEVQQNREFVKNLKEVKLWAPVIKWNALALMCDMFAVAIFSGIMLYIWDKPQVPLFGPNSSIIMSHNAFIAVYNCCTFLGDAISRKVAYLVRPFNPLLFLILTVSGSAMCLSKIAVLAWPGIFCVLWANGSIYATTTRHVDNNVMKGHNLVALSTWLFMGDVGSTVGSNLLIYVKAAIGATHCHHCAHPY